MGNKAWRKHILEGEYYMKKHFLDKEQGRIVWETHREEES